MHERLQAEFADTAAGPMVEFFQAGTRGFSQERRPPKTVTLKLRKETDDLETPAAPVAAAKPVHVPAPTAAPAVAEQQSIPLPAQTRALMIAPPTFGLIAKAG